MLEPRDSARVRAVSPDEKANRRDAILDAADQLMRDAPERVGVMAEVAQAAGLAKGTVYLYFPSKESLLLALHERHCEAFFQALIARVESTVPMTLDHMLAVTHEHIISHETYLPCASVCFGSMERSMPVEDIQSHLTRVGEWMLRAAHGVRVHFNLPNDETAIALLRRSYALMIGLWQLLKPEAQARVAPDSRAAKTFRAEYANEVEISLRALWLGSTNTIPARLGTGLAPDEMKE